VAFYVLPWLPLFLVGLWQAARRLVQRRLADPAASFALVWVVASLVVLTLSVTKRDIYLAPIIPGFALCCVFAMDSGERRFLRWFAVGWSSLCAIALFGVAASPLWSRWLPERIPAAMVAVLRRPSAGHAVMLISGLLAIGVIRRRQALGHSVMLAAVTALAYASFFTVPAQVIDARKRLDTLTRAFVAGVPALSRGRIAGWGATETERAMLYAYGDWSLPSVDETGLAHILNGTHPDYDSAVVLSRHPVPDFLMKTPYRVLGGRDPAEDDLHKRDMTWIQGTAVARRTPIRPMPRETQ
jgi:hypothetical protein